jgi:hypothetical protein
MKTINELNLPIFKTIIALKSLVLLIIVLTLSSCKMLKKDNVEYIRANDILYAKAIETAMSPTKAKINNDLIPITSANDSLIRDTILQEEYILVVTWKNDTTYFDSSVYNTGNYPIWVTTAPELLKRMKKEAVDSSKVDLRLKQLLGLPESSVYNYFVELWVKPSDLFRPCPDNNINDKECKLCFPDSTNPGYVLWINENRISRYYECKLQDKYPWTQLGYTFDWNRNNATHYGLSEFVIGKNKTIYKNKIYTTVEYLKKRIYVK